MKNLRDWFSSLVAPAPEHAEPVRQGSVVFKQQNDRAHIDPQSVVGQSFVGELTFQGKRRREAWIISGPTPTIIVLDESAISKTISALCLIYGTEASQYHWSASWIYIDVNF